MGNLGKILITGASGQIGSRVTEYIVKERKLNITNPQDVVCLVRTPEKSPFLSDWGVTLVTGDLEDKTQLNRIFADYNIEYVFHLAAYVSMFATYEEMYGPNVVGTQNLLKAFVGSAATTFIYTSSISVYEGYLSFHEKVNIFDETTPLGTLNPDEAVDPYSVTKRQAEVLVQQYTKDYPEKTFVITRLGPAIGPRDRKIIPAFVKVLPWKVPKLINHGTEVFNATPTWDIARAQVFLAEQGHGISGNAYNVVGPADTFLSLFSACATYYHRKPPRANLPLWLFHVFKPFLRLLRRLRPHNLMLQTLFSETALHYLGKQIIYNTDKLESLGFMFVTSTHDSIFAALQELDPEKRLVKPNLK